MKAELARLGSLNSGCVTVIAGGSKATLTGLEYDDLGVAVSVEKRRGGISKSVSVTLDAGEFCSCRNLGPRKLFSESLLMLIVESVSFQSFIESLDLKIPCSSDLWEFDLCILRTDLLFDEATPPTCEPNLCPNISSSERLCKLPVECVDEVSLVSCGVLSFKWLGRRRPSLKRPTTRLGDSGCIIGGESKVFKSDGIEIIDPRLNMADILEGGGKLLPFGPDLAKGD